MKKENTIRKNYEFQEIINNHKQKVTNFVVAYYRTNNNKLRVGISVSKKFANAVMRNKYKNQVKSILNSLDLYKINKDVVLILRKTFLPLSFSEKKEKIKEVFERIISG